ncbi:MAG TPA: MarR family transcriptional regulator [Mycobacteriales bacterium]|nr:MarR family transcriptional regulator [Mycobacteriales bacterium]
MSYANDVTPTSLHTEAGLAGALRISVSRLARRMRYQRSEDMPTPTELAVLGTLNLHGPLTPGELARHEKVQPPSMTRVLAGLESQGLVTRAAHPTDGRQSLVALSAAGERALSEGRRRKDAWLAQRLATLSRADRELLRAAAPILDRLGQA